MVRIACQTDLSEDDLRVIEAWVGSNNNLVFEARSRSVPSFAGVGGGIVLHAVGFFVVSILGGGALIVLKSLLESIGSELGKRFLERIQRKTRHDSDRYELLTLLYEISPRQVLLITLNSPGLEQLEALTNALDSALEDPALREPHILMANYSQSASQWKVVPFEGLGVLHYYDELGHQKSIAPWEER